MQVEEELTRFSPDKDMALTIGVFDGVHLGHKLLISRLREEAVSKDLLAGVVTFYQHPEELLSPRNGLLFITDIEERIELLRGEGVDIVIPLSFTTELAQLGARTFVGLLQKHLRMRALVIGFDFAMGKQREGDIENLRELGEEMGFSVDVVPPLIMKEEIVSSTAIRKVLASGDMKRVSELAGRPFSLRGKVVSGAGRGAGLGFPTANLAVAPDHAMPPDGVYASRSHIDGIAYPSMTNIGQCPTFGGCERTVETFVLDYEGDLYGREMKLDIIDRIRDEKKFDSVEDLKRQVAEDIARGRVILDVEGGEQK